MTPSDASPGHEPAIRETFLEHTVDRTRVATIADPENAAAWIQSTVSRPLEP